MTAEPSQAGPATAPLPASEAVALVAKALGDHEVVGLGEWHGSATEHAFFDQLLADPGVQPLVDVIVVEFGAAPEQAVIDRYTAGDPVTDAELARVWTTTTQQSGVWNSPIYRQFYERIREMNRASPSHRIRVLLGDPGLAATLCGQPGLATDAPCIERDGFLADRINEAVDTGSRVVVVAGVFHLWRTAGRGADSATSRVESTGHRVFVVLPFGARLSSDPDVGSRLTTLRQGDVVQGGWLADVNAAVLRGTTTVECDHPPCETEPPLGSLAAVADAFVYLGG